MLKKMAHSVLMVSSFGQRISYEFDTYAKAYYFHKKWQRFGAQIVKKSKKPDNLDLFDEPEKVLVANVRPPRRKRKKLK